MPYNTKEKIKENQKRTQSKRTIYMREWRKKNRGHHRKYIREWAKKRRHDKEKREQDKKAPGFVIFQEKNKIRWRGLVASIDNLYVKGLLVRRNPELKNIINDELITIHKLQLLTKRKLKEYDNRS
jgi:hypothetical protein